MCPASKHARLLYRDGRFELDGQDRNLNRHNRLAAQPDLKSIDTFLRQKHVSQRSEYVVLDDRHAYRVGTMFRDASSTGRNDANDHVDVIALSDVREMRHDHEPRYHERQSRGRQGLHEADEAEAAKLVVGV